MTTPSPFDVDEAVRTVDHVEKCLEGGRPFRRLRDERRIRTSSVRDVVPGAADWALIPSENDSTGATSVTKHSAFRISTSSPRSPLRNALEGDAEGRRELPHGDRARGTARVDWGVRAPYKRAE